MRGLLLGGLAGFALAAAPARADLLTLDAQINQQVLADAYAGSASYPVGPLSPFGLGLVRSTASQNRFGINTVDPSLSQGFLLFRDEAPGFLLVADRLPGAEVDPGLSVRANQELVTVPIAFSNLTTADLLFQGLLGLSFGSSNYDPQPFVQGGAIPVDYAVRLSGEVNPALPPPFRRPDVPEPTTVLLWSLASAVALRLGRRAVRRCS